MTPTLARLLAVPAVVAAAMSIATLDPTRLAGAEVHQETDPFVTAADPELTAISRELSARLEAVADRIVVKEEMIEQLLAGHLGLAAVADRFLWLNTQAPNYLDLMRSNFPASDDRESAALNVLEYARQRTTAADKRRVWDRLAGEYRAAFHHAPQQ